LRCLLRLSMSFQRSLMSLYSMLHGLFRMLMARLMILFSVMRGRRTMRVCRLFVKFCCALVKFHWHDGSSYNMARPAIENL
jgi:hypothetical protein